MVFRIGILGFLVIVAFAILFFRLWALRSPVRGAAPRAAEG